MAPIWLAVLVSIFDVSLVNDVDDPATAECPQLDACPVGLFGGGKTIGYFTPEQFL
jgi:hypothetical protein